MEIKCHPPNSAARDTSVAYLVPGVRFFLFCFAFLYIYLFYFYSFLAALGLHRGAWASHCGGFSCCGARALGARASVVVCVGFSSCGSRALRAQAQ